MQPTVTPTHLEASLLLARLRAAGSERLPLFPGLGLLLPPCGFQFLVRQPRGPQLGLHLPKQLFLLLLGLCHARVPLLATLFAVLGVLALLRHLLRLLLQQSQLALPGLSAGKHHLGTLSLLSLDLRKRSNGMKKDVCVWGGGR
jgi:hypothetical protein